MSREKKPKLPKCDAQPDAEPVKPEPSEPQEGEGPYRLSKTHPYILSGPGIDEKDPPTFSLR